MTQKRKKFDSSAIRTLISHSSINRNSGYLHTACENLLEENEELEKEIAELVAGTTAPEVTLSLTVCVYCKRPPSLTRGHFVVCIGKDLNKPLHLDCVEEALTEWYTHKEKQ